ncbi:hypothetical protein F6B93_10385 [Mycobacterium spongiae]|uniref:Uncharacterized protein n=1 Tax=Mycobacterium spongiae TaxID=886343 RepID=A0A975K1M6_9MYCO|nr:hypothetical protein F6B93_10385 [Mycobacterium spongiae]
MTSQASAAAVKAGHAAITFAMDSLSVRVRASATKVVAADDHYLANEARSAAELAAVTDLGTRR